MSRFGRRSSIVVTIGSVAVAFSQWYYIWLFARAAGGPEIVGLYSTVLGVATPIFVVAQLGLRNIYLTLSTEVRWRVYIIVRGCGIVGGIGALFVVSAFMLDIPGNIVGSVALLKASNAVSDLYYGRLQRDGKLSLLGTIWCAKALFTTVTATIIVAFGGSIALALVAGGVVALASAIWAARVSVRRAPEESGSMKPEVRAVIGAGLPLSIAQALSSLIVYLPVLLLTTFSSATEVGIYSAASYLVVLANLIGASVQVVLIPSLRVRMERLGRRDVWSRTSKYAVHSLLSGLIMVCIVTLIGDYVLSFVYGTSFTIGRASLVVIATGATASFLGFLFGTAQLVLNDYRGQSRVAISSLAAGCLAGLPSFILFAPVTAACCTATAAAIARLFHSGLRARALSRA